MAFKMKSGNKVSFKNMGSSPAKQDIDTSLDSSDADAIIERDVERKRNKELAVQIANLESKDSQADRTKRILEGKIGATLYDWWEINQIKNVSKEKTNHPCQIPEEIINKIIKITANKKDTIIDVFAGSGTVSKVANELDYNTISYEIDKDYCKIINLRLNTLQYKIW